MNRTILANVNAARAAQYRGIVPQYLGARAAARAQGYASAAMRAIAEAYAARKGA